MVKTGKSCTVRVIHGYTMTEIDDRGQRTVRIHSIISTIVLAGLPGAAFAVTPVPEPSTMALLAIGGVAVGVSGYLKRRKK